jgi:hypothetical protein
MEILSLIAIVISVIAISRSNDATARIAKLEKGLKGEGLSKVPNISKPLSIDDSVTSVSRVQYNETEDIPEVVVSSNDELEENLDVQAVAEEVVEPYKEPAFVTWLKEDWLLKFGGVLVLMGILFFLSIAFTLIGQQGKIAVGYIIGVSFMLFGFKYAKKQLVGGSVIHLLGAIIIIITTYIARTPAYNLFDPYLAMLLMFLTTVCLALTAFAYNRPQLAHVGLFIASLVPLFTGTLHQGFASTLLYLGVVTLGVLWLALVTKWRTLVLLSLSIVCVYSLIKISGGIGANTVTFTESYLLVVFGILFYVTSLFSILRSKGVSMPADGAVALLNAGYALMWITSQVSHELAPIVIAMVGLAYAVGFFFVYKITDVYTSFIIYGGVAVGMLTTSVVLELSGRSETVALILIGAGITLFTYYLSNNESITKIVSLFNMLPLMYVFNSIAVISRIISGPSNMGRGELWKDFLIVIMAMIVYFFLGSYFMNRVKDLSKLFQGAGVLMLVVLTWEIIHLLLGGVFATSISFLVITTSLTLYAYYKSNNEAFVQAVGLMNIIPMFYVINSIVKIDRATNNIAMRGDIWKDWVVVVLALVIYFSMYRYFVNKVKVLGYVSFSAGVVLSIVFVWQFLHAVIPSVGLATFISILLYTVVGLFVLLQGTQEKNETKIKIARLWLGLVAARVIFHDAWTVGDQLLGVLICFVVGVLLLSSAFIIKKVATE